AYVPKVLLTGSDDLSRDVTVTGLNDNGTLWQVVYQVVEDDAGIESDLDFSIVVTDPVGNEKDYGSVSDLTEEAQPEKQARLDTNLPEVTEAKFTSSNAGDDPDHEETLLSKDGDTVTLTFTTSERIASPDDEFLPPTVIFRNSSGEDIAEGVINVLDSDDSGTLWEATLEVGEGLVDLETNLGFGIRVYDPSGNEREIRFDSGLAQLAAGDESTSNDGVKARIDTDLPEVTEDKFTSSNTGRDPDHEDTLLSKSGDT
ncbi:MAG: hypothetical protein QF614_09145, partial [SAR324 cluster bacterium]|nr:hypothetical protein [SAR324 cluster bacterium]